MIKNQLFLHNCCNIYTNDTQNLYYSFYNNNTRFCPTNKTFCCIMQFIKLQVKFYDIIANIVNVNLILCHIVQVWSWCQWKKRKDARLVSLQTIRLKYIRLKYYIIDNIKKIVLFFFLHILCTFNIFFHFIFNIRNLAGIYKIEKKERIKQEIKSFQIGYSD